jgi:hypothetical protein
MADDNSTAPTIPTSQLQDLQDGISASIQTILKAYDACNDPVESAALLNQSHQLAAQMSQIETALFHQQAINATATVSSAFTSAQGFIAELNGLTSQLEKVSAIIASAAKLVGVVAQILPCLAVL